MTIPKEVTTLVSLTNNGMIWVYIALFFILSYLLVSLLTWSFIKPLKYLSYPTIIVGLLFIVIRFCSSILLNSIDSIKNLSIIKSLLPSVLKPMLFNGLLCLIIGIVMLVIYILINKKKKKTD